MRPVGSSRGDRRGLMVLAATLVLVVATYAIAAGCGALGVGSWVWSAYDAPRAARRTNAKRILHRDASLGPFIQRAPGGAVTAGLAVSL